MRLHPGRTLLYALAGLFGAALTLVFAAPASFADRALESATDGRMRLAETDGTIWRGSGRLVLIDVGADQAARRSVSGVAVPGRIDWHLRQLPLLVGQIDAAIRVEGMTQPVRVQGGYDEVRVGGGSLTLPSVELGRMGSPWNTLRPSGALGLRWENLTLRQHGLEGRAQIELREASSAMTPVKPLGSYRVEIVGRGGQADLSIQTLAGPLRLQGNGRFSAQEGLRFTAEATVDPAEQGRLQSFLGLIGRRDGDKTIIKIGA
ncbi:MAG: type II secretion system protein N [Burkholderiales bacterium]|nr:MAG: type II secretion system protein N [Burkholderiales bacterium]